MKCSICSREIPSVVFAEKHHLMPSCEGGKEKVSVCVDCGNQIHKLFTVHELRDQYSTLETLKSNEKVRKWIKWIRRRNTFGVCMKAKKRR
jgi:5-methylcytosine-specific restriction protein A